MLYFNSRVDTPKSLHYTSIEEGFIVMPRVFTLRSPLYVHLSVLKPRLGSPLDDQTRKTTLKPKK